MEESRQREVDTTMKSYWITATDQKEYTISSLPIETGDKKELVSALLKEFVHSTEAEKVEFKKQLEEWLDGMGDDVLELENVEKLRDLIYEMF